MAERSQRSYSAEHRALYNNLHEIVGTTFFEHQSDELIYTPEQVGLLDSWKGLLKFKEVRLEPSQALFLDCV